MKTNLPNFAARALLTAIFTTTCLSTHAALFIVPKAELSPPAINPNGIVHFDEVPDRTPIDGLSIKGFAFSENIPVALTTFSGPGDTNNLTAPYATNTLTALIDPASYVLTVRMPGLEDRFGFGFAINNSTPTANALTVTLFNGSTNLGSLTYAGVPDPVFDGGFAGIGSTIRFDRAEITFSASSKGLFALDNFAIPEPGTLVAGLLVVGACGFARVRRGWSAAG